MAQNYNINSSFGFNVMPKNPQGQAPEQENSLFERTADFFDSITGFVDKYDNVFNGEVEREINLISRQMMIVGMNLKSSDNNVRRFDMNI